MRNGRIRLTLPKLRWEKLGEVVPKEKWPRLSVDAEKLVIQLRMDGPSALAPSRIVDRQGKELSRDVIMKRLSKETPVLVSVSGDMPDAYHLQLTREDALIVLVGPRDGAPATEWLPAAKAKTVP